MKFELKVVDEDITNGMIQLGWCVTPELIEYLKEKGYSDPGVVVVVKNKSRGDEVRHVFKLMDLIGYVGFKYPGETNIYAFIEKNYRCASNYLVKRYSGYETTIISFDDWSSIFSMIPPDDSLTDDEKQDYKDYFAKYLPNVSADVISLDIPKEAFAKDPHPWEEAWVNWLMTDDINNQCDFRQRRLFAYTIQPFLFVFNLCLRLIIATFTFALGYKIVWQELWPLRKFDPSYIAGDHLIFSKKRNEKFTAEWKKAVTTWDRFKLLTPMILSVLLIPALLLLTLVSCMWSTTPILIIVAVLIIISIIFSAFLLSKEEEELKLVEPKNWLTKENFELLTCQDGKPYSYNNLPSKKKTLKLRFNYLKSRICRPFAG